MLASFQRFFGVGRVRLEKEDASRGKEALALFPESASKSENKQNIMSDTNFRNLRREGMRLKHHQLVPPPLQKNTHLKYTSLLRDSNIIGSIN